MIELKNISKNYVSGEMTVEALKNVSINFRQNEFVSILGPSGCGKTTLLNIVGGLDKYTSGDIIIDGVSTKDYKDKDWDTYRNHYIGFVFQSYNLISHLSVLENVELALSIAGYNKKDKRAMAIAALERVGLKQQIKKKPNQLSGGQMQRVAIARAIVNNPKIILADEPTGALDTETSVQVMDILKEISKSCLVVMVTHNENLAADYSDRIINILDGVVTGDSNPYSPSEKSIEKQNEKVEQEKAEVKKPKKQKSSMGVFTSLSLSLKNLFSKKWKTAITAFAGSIGIIGIALVLSVSNGMNAYVGNMQSEALSGYPVTIGTVAIDYDALKSYFSSNEENKTEVDKNTQTSVYSIQNMLYQFGNFNFLSSDFVEYVNDYVKLDNNKADADKKLTSFKLSYATTLKILTQTKGVVMMVSTDSITNSTSGTTTTSTFFEGVSNRDYILENYEILGGENAHYPENKNELALVIGSDNSIAYETLMALGLSDDVEISASEKTTLVNLDKFVGKEYRFLTNNQYYTKNTDGTFSAFNYDVKNVAENAAKYNLAADNKLKISCVLRLKDNSSSQILSNGVMYLPELSEYLRENAKNSEIVTETLKLSETDKLYVPFSLQIGELKAFISSEESKAYFNYETCASMISIVKQKFNISLTKDDAMQLALQMLGASDLPTSVMFYTSSFDAKKDVMDYINAWNSKTTERNNKIVINDAAGFLTETLGSLIDIVSYVLIAFSAISLVVSSIMIGVITYTSVIERTKEIGVLRSIGARKKDIARVFNAETFAVGLISGVLGVTISFILTFPISALIKKLAGGTIKTSLSFLTISNVLILVGISVVLTLIAGLFPALMAAKKDPVKALRTE